MADISQVNAQLWTGAGINTAADVEQLVADLITADLDCRELDDATVISQLATAPALAYLYNPTEDDGQHKPVSWFATAWSWALPLLQAGAVLLCHCDAGVNRGPSMAYFFLRSYWKLAPEAAFDLLKAQRPVINAAYSGDADAAITSLGLG